MKLFKLIKKSKRIAVIMASGLMTMTALAATTVSTLAWFSHMNAPITGVVESGSPDLAIQSVTGYKEIDGLQSVATIEAGEETTHQDTDDKQYDIPTSGAGYYFIPQKIDETTEETIFKYNNPGVRKFDEFTGDPNLARLSNVVLNVDDIFQVRQYTFSNSQTNNAPYEFSGANDLNSNYCEYVDAYSAVRVTAAGTYNIWLDHANETLGFELVSNLAKRGRTPIATTPKKLANENINGIKVWVNDKTNNWSRWGDVHLVLESVVFASNSGYQSINDMPSGDGGGDFDAQWSGASGSKFLVKLKYDNVNSDATSNRKYYGIVPWYILSATASFYANSGNYLHSKNEGKFYSFTVYRNYDYWIDVTNDSNYKGSAFWANTNRGTSDSNFKYSEERYSVTINSQGGTELANQTVFNGGIVENYPTRDNYIFAKYTTGSSYSSSTVGAITSDQTIYAQWDASFDAGTYLYLKPSNKWLEANARFAVCLHHGDPTGETWVKMAAIADGYFACLIPTPGSGQGKWRQLTFARLDPSKPDYLGWEGSSGFWNQTGDLTPSSGNNCFAITDESTHDRPSGTWGTCGASYFGNPSASSVYYLKLNSDWTSGTSRYYVNVCNGTSANSWIQGSQIGTSNYYSFTLPAGKWYTLIYVRMNTSGEPAWDNLYNSQKTADLTPNASYRLWDLSSSAWVTHSRTVSGSSNGHGTVSVSTSTVELGGSSTLTPNPSTGYEFSKWNDNSTTNPLVLSNIVENQSFTATFTAKSFTVEYHINNGGEDQTFTQSLTYDSGATLTSNSFSWSGHRFDGWATSSSGAVAYTNSQDLNASGVNGLYALLDNGITHLYAKWVEIPTYTVTINVSEAGYGTVTSSSILNVPQGTAYSTSDDVLTVSGFSPVTANPTSQTPQYTYSFDRWSSASGSVTSNITITAYFTRTTRQYSATFVKGYGVTGVFMDNNATPVNEDPTNTSYDYGETVYVFATLKANGWKAPNGWVLVEGSTYIVDSETMDENGISFGTISAEGKTYSITYVVNGGDSIENGEYQTKGTSYDWTLANPTRTGYNFASYAITTPPTGTASVSSKTLTIGADTYGDITVSISWNAKQAALIFNANGGSGGPGSGTVTATYDAAMPNISANLPSRSGYVFLGYFDGSGAQYYKNDGTSYTKWNQNTESSVTLYAHWRGYSYSIHFDGNGNTSGEMSNQTGLVYGTSSSISSNSFLRTGYSFQGWSRTSDGSVAYTDEDSIVTPSPIPTDSGSITLYAIWQIDVFYISFNGSSPTSGSMATITITYGVAFNLTANGFAKTGYTFLGWDTDNSADEVVYSDGASFTSNDVKSLYDQVHKEETLTLYAVWRANLFNPGDVVYFAPSSNWAGNNAWFALYVYYESYNGDNKPYAWATFEKITDRYYKVVIPEYSENAAQWDHFTIARMNPSYTDYSWDSGKCWNKVEHIARDPGNVNAFVFNDDVSGDRTKGTAINTYASWRHNIFIKGVLFLGDDATEIMTDLTSSTYSYRYINANGTYTYQTTNLPDWNVFVKTETCYAAQKDADTHYVNANCSTSFTSGSALPLSSYNSSTGDYTLYVKYYIASPKTFYLDAVKTWNYANNANDNAQWTQVWIGYYDNSPRLLFQLPTSGAILPMLYKVVFHGTWTFRFAKSSGDIGSPDNNFNWTTEMVGGQNTNYSNNQLVHIPNANQGNQHVLSFCTPGYSLGAGDGTIYIYEKQSDGTYPGSPTKEYSMVQGTAGSNLLVNEQGIEIPAGAKIVVTVTDSSLNLNGTYGKGDYDTSSRSYPAYLDNSASDIVTAIAGRFNFYIYTLNSVKKLVITDVPMLGNGFYIMPSVNGNTVGFENCIKMHTISAVSATYVGLNVTNNATYYIRSYTNGIDKLFMQDKYSGIAGIGSVSNTGVLTFTSGGTFSISINEGIITITAFQTNDFFRLGGLDKNSSSSVIDQKTSIVLEIVFTMSNVADMDVYVTLTNPFGTNVGCAFYATNKRLSSGCYNYMRTHYYSALTSNSATLSAQTSILAGGSGEQEYYGYILIDYLTKDTDWITNDNKAYRVNGIVLHAEQRV